ncbi:MAG: protein kinase, partial [Polyangiaceae bacterium]|nr:protein kinase [Polyangiaceae bacterium]
NLLMTPDNHVKLADFGVARIPDAALTREGQFLGTPCYAAPETLKAGTYGPLTDLFSMAAVVYEAAAGERAFPGGDAVAVAHKVLHDEPLPPSQTPQGGAIPAEVDEVILRGLAKDPSHRYSSARELAYALRVAYEDAGIAMPSPAAPLSRSTELSGAFGPSASNTREPSSVAFYAVMLSALAIGIGLILAFRSEDATREPDAMIASAESTGGSSYPAVPLVVVEPQAPAIPDAGHAAQAPVLTEEAPSTVVAEALPAPETLTAHEREELAKNALGRARRAMRNGDLAAARAALAEATLYDPENGDITRMLAELEATAPPGAH